MRANKWSIRVNSGFSTRGWSTGSRAVNVSCWVFQRVTKKSCDSEHLTASMVIFLFLILTLFRLIWVRIWIFYQPLEGSWKQGERVKKKGKNQSWMHLVSGFGPVGCFGFILGFEVLNFKKEQHWLTEGDDSEFWAQKYNICGATSFLAYWVCSYPHQIVFSLAVRILQCIWVKKIVKAGLEIRGKYCS